MSHHLWRELYLQTKVNGAFSRILDPLTKRKKENQIWLQEQVPNFMEEDDVPSSSLDLNPLDYRLRLVLEEQGCTQMHSLKAAREIPLTMIRESIDDQLKRLRCCTKQKSAILSNSGSNVFFKVFSSFLENFLSISFVFASK